MCARRGTEGLHQMTELEKLYGPDGEHEDDGGKEVAADAPREEKAGNEEEIVDDEEEEERDEYPETMERKLPKGYRLAVVAALADVGEKKKRHRQQPERDIAETFGATIARWDE